jgi:hypothetical protein
LPDGIFSNQKSPLGKILEGLGMEEVGKYILWPFGIYYGQIGTFYVHSLMYWQFGIFSPDLVYCVKKNLATLHATA